MDITDLSLLNLMPRKTSRVTDSNSPGSALSFDPLWANVDLDALNDVDKLRSYLLQMKRKWGHSDKCRVYQYILSIGALRMQSLKGIKSDWELLISVLYDLAPRFLQSPWASCGEFVRLLQLASECVDPKLTRIVLSVWAHRIRARQLSPVSAILIADDFGYRNFLAAVLYEYLLLVESRVASAQFCRSDYVTASPLSRAQNLRVCQGYYAFEACLGDLCKRSLRFPSGPRCRSHSECLSIWESRWSSSMCKVPRGSPIIDILGRLQAVHIALSKDHSLSMFMTEDCRRSALNAVLKKRERIVNNLYHYFDL